MAWGYLVSLCNRRASSTTLDNSGLVEVTDVRVNGLPMSRCELTDSTMGPTLVYKRKNLFVKNVKEVYYSAMLSIDFAIQFKIEIF